MTPNKIVNIIRSLYNNNRCHVIHDMDLSEPFTVLTSDGQGCSIVIDWVMKKRSRCIQWTLANQLKDIGYVDNIGLLTH